MKALTIYQPWASLVMAGAKPYEFRSWNPRTRGPSYAALIGQRIVIHSSTRNIDHAEVLVLLDILKRGSDTWKAETCLHVDKAMPVLEKAADRDATMPFTLKHGDLPWGVGLGTAVLGEPRNGIEIAEEFGVPRVNDSDRHEHANWGWPMLDIEVWDMPIECRGFQGFWNWPSPGDVGL